VIAEWSDRLAAIGCLLGTGVVVAAWFRWCDR
jgi:hypothetical protein